MSDPNKIYIGQPGHMRLEIACALIHHAYGPCYLVGRCLTHRDYRHVDIRVILDDQAFLAEFGVPYETARHTPRWLCLSVGLSAYMAQATGLPVDLQIQSQTWSDLWFADERRVPVGNPITAEGGQSDV